MACSRTLWFLVSMLLCLPAHSGGAFYESFYSTRVGPAKGESPITKSCYNLKEPKDIVSPSCDKGGVTVDACNELCNNAVVSGRSGWNAVYVTFVASKACCVCSPTCEPGLVLDGETTTLSLLHACPKSSKDADCTAGETWFEAKNCKNTNNGCTACATVCPAGLGELTPCNIETNTVCAKCESGKQWNDGKQLKCEACQTCSKVQAECTVTSDTVCVSEGGDCSSMPKISHGGTTKQCTVPVKDGGTCTIACSAGYYPKGSPVAVCKGGTWDTQVECLALPEGCSAMDAVKGVCTTCLDPNNSVLDSKAERCVCIAGFVDTNSGTAYNELVCEAEKSGGTGECASLPKISHGGATKQCEVPVKDGGTCTIACSTGYYPKGSPVAVCKSGTWDTQVECLALPEGCSAMDTVTGAGVCTTCVDLKNSVVNSKGDRCVCIAGFVDTNSGTAYNELVCEPEQSGGTSCASLPSVANGAAGKCEAPAVEGTKCDVGCNTGYYLSGEGSALCTKGSWVVQGSCVANPEGCISVNGQGVCTACLDPIKATVDPKLNRCVCNPPLVDSNAGTAYNQLVCTDNAASGCSDGPKLAHASALRCLSPFTEGKTCSFICDTGYYLLGEKPSVMCTKGDWLANGECLAVPEGCSDVDTATGKGICVACQDRLTMTLEAGDKGEPNRCVCNPGLVDSNSGTAYDELVCVPDTGECVSAPKLAGADTSKCSVPAKEGDQCDVVCVQGYFASGVSNTAECVSGQWVTKAVCTTLPEGCSAVNPKTGLCTACVDSKTSVLDSKASRCICVDGLEDADPGTGYDQLDCQEPGKENNGASNNPGEGCAELDGRTGFCSACLDPDRAIPLDKTTRCVCRVGYYDSESVKPDVLTCKACQNGAGKYVCADHEGYYRTGSVCPGDGVVDTQTCELCGHGGVLYKCPLSEEPTGVPCTGETDIDTQTCSGDSTLGEGCAMQDKNLDCTACVSADAIPKPHTAACMCRPGFYDADGKPTTLTCKECGNGGTKYNECAKPFGPQGFYLNGVACTGATKTDTQTCTACAYGTAYPDEGCPAGMHAIGTKCDGTTTVDTQTCAAITEDLGLGEGCQKLDGNGACSSCTASPLAVPVKNKNSCVCLPGYYDSDTDDKTLTCKLCGNGGVKFECEKGAGYHQTGPACTGAGKTDTQTCDECRFGGLAYACPGNQERSGVVCDPRQAEDTQTCKDKTFLPGEGCASVDSTTGVCTKCLDTPNSRVVPTTNRCACVVGFYDSDSSAATPQSLTCKVCGNGGASAYVCSESKGYHLTGERCTGTTHVDTQTCEACQNGGANYACPSGYGVTGTPCVPTSATDTQECTLNRAPLRCPTAPCPANAIGCEEAPDQAPFYQCVCPNNMYWDKSKGICAGCSSTCPPGFAQFEKCSAMADIVCTTACVGGVNWNDGKAISCKPCTTQCSSGSFISAACAPTHDRTCSGCSVVCPAGQGQTTACDGIKDRVCGACVNGLMWNDGNYLTCQACPMSCPGGSWRADPCVITQRNQCQECRSCEGGTTTTPCAPTADAVCGVTPQSCVTNPEMTVLNGALMCRPPYASGTSCKATCNPGFQSAGQALCTNGAWTGSPVCNALPRGCTAVNSDARCTGCVDPHAVVSVPQNRCVCPDGFFESEGDPMRCVECGFGGAAYKCDPWQKQDGDYCKTGSMRDTQLCIDKSYCPADCSQLCTEQPGFAPYYVCPCRPNYYSTDAGKSCLNCRLVCPAGQSMSERCGTTADVQCANACRPGVSFNDGTYLTCQDCAKACRKGEREVSPCTAKADRVCAPIIPSSSSSTGVSSSSSSSAAPPKEVLSSSAQAVSDHSPSTSTKVKIPTTDLKIPTIPASQCPWSRQDVHVSPGENAVVLTRRIFENKPAILSRPYVMSCAFTTLGSGGGKHPDKPTDGGKPTDGKPTDGGKLTAAEPSDGGKPDTPPATAEAEGGDDGGAKGRKVGDAVWGDRWYTMDSEFCVAARHATGHSDGRYCVEFVADDKITPTLSFPSVTANEVTSKSWDHEYPVIFHVIDWRAVDTVVPPIKTIPKDQPESPKKPLAFVLASGDEIPAPAASLMESLLSAHDQVIHSPRHRLQQRTRDRRRRQQQQQPADDRLQP